MFMVLIQFVTIFGNLINALIFLTFLPENLNFDFLNNVATFFKPIFTIIYFNQD